MSDRYSGNIECPYCYKLTEFYLMTDNTYDFETCENCGKKFCLNLEIKATKLLEKPKQARGQ